MEKWNAIEKNVNEAENKKRQADNASRVLYNETEIPKKDRQEKTNDEILKKGKRERVTQKALDRETIFSKEAEDILGDPDSSERILVNFRKENLVKALRYEKAVKMQRQKLLDEEAKIMKSFNGAPHGEELEALDEIRNELNKNHEFEGKLVELNPEAYFGLNLKKLKEYKKDFSKGRIVETEYVKEKMEDIMLHLGANKPILIHGHLGSGKSELAKYVAKKCLGKDACVVSGRKLLPESELYGHQNLTVDEKSGATISDFHVGPIYSAMEEGRLVIIDEVNAIPHELLISLNDILTKKVGDKITIQQDSGREVEIKEGFGIIMTGNLNQGQEKYIDRQDMDPAFLSRLHKIEYDYLPQSTEGSLEDEAGVKNEQFHLMLANIMDGHGNIEAPEDSVKKLWNLAKAARVIQNVFAGKEIDSAYYFKEGGGRAAKYLLKESVFSLRAIENVISQWKVEGYDKELDYYVYNNFIKEGTIASDRAYLYQIMKDQFGFFKNEGWEQNPNYGSGGVVNSFDVDAPKNKPAKRKFWGPREVVEFAFGKAPERAKWPESPADDGEQESIINPEIMEMGEFKDKLKKEMEEIFNEIGEVCEMEK